MQVFLLRLQLEYRRVNGACGIGVRMLRVKNGDPGLRSTVGYHFLACRSSVLDKMVKTDLGGDRR